MTLSSEKTNYEHIVLDEKGVPIVAGTTMKVIEVALEKAAHGWSPEELHFQHPYLTLGQIYSALGYYCDNQAELDKDIERRLAFVNQSRSTSDPAPLVDRLKSKGLI